ncbi:flagellar hook-associated protein FlgL [Roseateles koreensis]|uniref:Flagellar hook-associated protein FlgL n=1 Tax=Roseateles koreensis TaxID=2987526 RepID=A0ABT5KMY7_9BURK|nr:flagellar hook-associated protein FlgL [Roseateles koreensis]MDC8784286.1 flagellar hook-associated protein FlgL [Roseateles koreensis]
MRVSTASAFDASIANLQRRQQQLQDTQQQLTSGKKISQASDDPTGAARAERAMVSIDRVDANQRALEASRNSMTLSESALGDSNEILQQVREAMVAAGNASYTDTERAGLATKIAGLRDQLLTIANRPDGSGGYLFAGQGSSTPPFLDQNGGVSFTGVPGTIQTGNMDKYPLSVNGQQAWEQAATGNGSYVTADAPNANTGNPAKGWIDGGRVTDPSLLTGHDYTIQITGTAPAAQSYSVNDTTLGTSVISGPYTPGKAISADGMAFTISGAPVDGDSFTVAPSTHSLKVFDVLDRAVADLKTPLRGQAQISQSNSARIRDLDSVMSNLQNARTQVGEQMNNLDNSESRLSAIKLYSKSEQSAAEDLDMTQGISNFQNQQSGYDTALKTYAMVQRMNMFQYISG